MIQPSVSTVRWAAGALLLGALAGCSKGVTAPPVAIVSFSAAKTRVPLGSPVELTYKFEVPAGATFDGDYRVFVHFLESDGTMTPWNDDHDPQIPTSQWKPGQTIQYTRTSFVPVFPYVGEVTVQVGLHKGPDRLVLQGPEPADRASASHAYKVGTLQVLPKSDSIFLNYQSGWQKPEFAAENPAVDWQWTRKSAVVTFANPRKDVTILLDFDARPDLFPDRPQQVTVYSGGQLVETFAADGKEPVIRRIPISAAQLGSADLAEVRLEVDRTFVPANLPAGGKDTRELGIRVYHVYVETR
jgi:hypothetical protein